MRTALRRLRASSRALLDQVRLKLRNTRSMRRIFTEIHERNLFGGTLSRSGTGSDLLQTAEIRKRLPALLEELGVETMLDIPCGDFHWMRTVPLRLRYTGADVVRKIVDRNREQHGEGRHFLVLDLVRSRLPAFDLVLCRDALVHFSDRHVVQALRNIRRSRSRYLLTTTFTDRAQNVDIPTGHWRPLNLQVAPFGLPKPMALINEKCTEGGGAFGDKSLGLWRVEEIPEFAAARKRV